MNGINPKEVLIGLMAFVALSFIFKFALLASFANIMMAFFPEESVIPIYLGIAASIAVTGLAIGKLINTRVSVNPIAHALIIGALAAIYKVIRPELDPLPFILITLFALLNFLAIDWSVHVTAPK